ncbi:DNA anti-recombination protein RmuC [Variovorax paradoxus]|uniref:DNA anti-recombination protein RmuC n=1 Tax=Variovorax paradoxus TaxID=34073 RepID=A0AAE4BZQ8_VARPD|nr:DUF802 domain-containing protein [Variovorax paradoxus]MDP9965191.1 DNA anti-recombination protein RmuC [Variovorax paradoxus]MDR6428374.1 DNA anti-recombination protein RmuC [Variovorax paradoxus]
MNRFLHYAVFAAGLAVVCWVGAGYVGSHTLALAVTMLVGAFYLMGALELHRFQQATATLSRAVADLSDPPSSLGAWLDRLHPTLRNAVRLRIEGERVGLPGPALTPYLAGLLVLLGMLGTFLGMVVTLNGTGMALESATDLPAIRASLSAPVKGLGLAFGTSVAGVAASAMLGLASALCRRERLQAGQMLDSRIATTLRAYSLAHQREASFQLLEQQAHQMPRLVDQLQAMMAAMERQSQALNERLAAGQAQFHTKAEAVYAGLASSVDQSLKQSLSESARIAGATIQPVVEATMAGIARETASLHDTVARTVQQQLDGLSSRFEAATASVAGTWQAALAEHQRTSEALSSDLRASHDRFAETFEQRSASLVEGVSARLESTAAGVSDTWSSALAQHQRVSEKLSQEAQQSLAAAAAGFEQHSTSLLRTVEQAHAALQSDIAARDEQRLSAWTQALATVSASLQQQWQQAGAHTASQQQQLFDALAQTARDMSTQAEAHAKNTVGEIAQLLQSASEAPRVAAEVVAELRQKLSDSMARDNAMLEERSRIMETLGTLLDAVNHASTEQRSAVDALVGASADVLDRVGSRFTEKVDEETGKMAAVAAQVTGSAVEVASLGEAFGFAVQLFSESNDKLVAHLQRVEGALGKSIARSDEQLAYYVAQAREVIDLSIMSQKQIVEDLQQIAGRQAAVGSEA